MDVWLSAAPGKSRKNSITTLNVVNCVVGFNFEDLPMEIFACILNHLEEPRQVLQCRLVSKAFARAASSNEVWKRFFRLLWPDEDLKTKNESCWIFYYWSRRKDVQAVEGRSSLQNKFENRLVEQHKRDIQEEEFLQNHPEIARMCKHCGKQFKPINNSNCRRHEGRYLSFLGEWSCCDAIYFDDFGCTIGAHETGLYVEKFY